MNERLKDMLIRHEGMRLDLYKCPAGYWTTGVGRNLEAKGITKKIALMMLEEDIAENKGYLSRFRWFTSLSIPRQDAILDMSFMGIGSLLGFKNMIAALERHDYDTAAAEMLRSRWAAQVGSRALELAHIMRTGDYQK